MNTATATNETAQTLSSAQAEWCRRNLVHWHGPDAFTGKEAFSGPRYTVHVDPAAPADVAPMYPEEQGKMYSSIASKLYVTSDRRAAAKFAARVTPQNTTRGDALVTAARACVAYLEKIAADGLESGDEQADALLPLLHGMDSAWSAVMNMKHRDCADYALAQQPRKLAAVMAQALRMAAQDGWLPAPTAIDIGDALMAAVA